MIMNVFKCIQEISTKIVPLCHSFPRVLLFISFFGGFSPSSPMFHANEAKLRIFSSIFKHSNLIFVPRLEQEIQERRYIQKYSQVLSEHIKHGLRCGSVSGRRLCRRGTLNE